MAQPSSPSNQDNQDQAAQSSAADAAAVPTSSNSDNIDWEAQIAFLRGLAQLVQQENLSEIEVEQGGVRLTLKSPAAVTLPMNAPLPMQAAPPQAVTGFSFVPEDYGVAEPSNADGGDTEATSGSEVGSEHSLAAIVTPMVGVFYRALSPGGPNCVEIGDHVEVGQTVGLVEAMKVFNEITSEVEGTVVEINAQNGELVETGHTLMMIQTQ